MTGAIQNDQDFTRRLTELTEANLKNEQFGVSELAHKMNMERSTLHRKVSKIFNISVSRFINQIRLQKALEMLQNTSATISETAYECGFHSATYFSKCFHDYYGFSPGEVKKQKEEVMIPATQTAIPKSKQNKWMLASVLMSALLIVLFFTHEMFNFHVLPENESLEKTIAVLPFKNESPDSTNAYFINGLMETIVNNLSKIEDLNVRSRTTVEKYRLVNKSLVEIAKELDVNYIVEGSGQKYGDDILLNIRLLEAKTDRHLFSEQYRKEIRGVNDLVDLQSEIALNIVSQIKAEITPEEKELIDKNSTFSLTAFDFYQRGREEHMKFRIKHVNTAALFRAEKYYREALKYDSGYAQAYAALADIFISKNRGKAVFSETILDSVLYFADKALAFDNRTAEAYAVKGLYYWYLGNRKKALDEYNKAQRYNPDLWQAYRGKGTLFIDNDPVACFENFQKAASLVSGSDLKMILEEMIMAYLWAGFTEAAKKYNNEEFRLFEDSVMFFINLGAIESQQGNIESAIRYYTKGFLADSTHRNYIWFYHDINRQLGFNYLLNRKYKESLNHFRKWIAILEKSGETSYNEMHRVAHAFWENGYTAEAEYYFDLQMEHCNNLIKTNHTWSQNYFAYYDRAAINAFRGNKDQAYKDLRVFNQITQVPLWMATLIKIDPLFDTLREDRDFQQIVKDVELKYIKEHERIKKLLQES